MLQRVSTGVGKHKRSLAVNCSTNVGDDILYIYQSMLFQNYSTGKIKHLFYAILYLLIFSSFLIKILNDSLFAKRRWKNLAPVSVHT